MLEFEPGAPDLVNVSATDKKSEGAENKKSEIGWKSFANAPLFCESRGVAEPSLTVMLTQPISTTPKEKRSYSRLARLEAIDARCKVLFPPWRSLSIRYVVWFYQHALKRAALPAHPFTLDFDYDVSSRMFRCEKTFSTTANAYVAQALEPIEKRYGVTLLYWFCIEKSADEVFHLHGAMALDDRLRSEVRSALRRVASGGSQVPASYYFAQIDDYDPQKSYRRFCGPFGWGNYAIKDHKKTETLGIGSPLVCCRPLNQSARLLHEGLRHQQLSQLKSSKRSLAVHQVSSV